MSKDSIATLIPYKIKINIIDLKSRSHNRSLKNDISISEVERAYKLTDNYYIVREIDFSSTSIPLDSFKNTKKMTQALIRETERFFGRLSILKESDQQPDDYKRKINKNVKNNIGFFLDNIFHNNAVSITGSNTKYAIAGLKWDGNFDEEYSENAYKVNVSLVISSLTGIGAFDGARKFCEGNKKALRNAVSNYFGYEKPNVKSVKNMGTTETTNYSYTIPNAPLKNINLGGTRRKHTRKRRSRCVGKTTAGNLTRHGRKGGAPKKKRAFKNKVKKSSKSKARD